MKLRDVVMTEGQLQRLREYLLARPDREELAFLLVSPAAGSDRIRLLVREVVEVPEDGFEHQGAAGLTPKMEAVLPIVERCSHEALGLIEVHSHPFDGGTETTFSAIDVTNMWAKYPFLQEVLAQAPVGALVFGKNAVDGLFWVSNEECLAPIHRLSIIGWPLVHLATTFSRRHSPWRDSPVPQEVFDRQVRAFGEGGQKLMGQLRVGIVGLGGIGSVLIEPLARLGVRDFVLVDSDVVEPSNLNRLAGAKLSDARDCLAKVEVARRALKSLGWPIRVEAIRASFQEPTALASLKTVDILFGGVDSHGSRLMINAFATQYMLPYIDCGTGIAVSENSSIEGIGGQVRIVLPDGPCLQCQGAIDHERAAFDLMPKEEQERHRRRGYVEGLDVPAPSVMPLNMHVAASAVDEFFALVTGYKGGASLLVHDLLSRTSTQVEVDRRQDCTSCGPNSQRAMGDLEPLEALAQHGALSPPPSGASNGTSILSRLLKRRG